MSEPPKTEESHEHLVNAFRAYLQTVITAGQYGKSARLATLPGAKTIDYCAALAKLPKNKLAIELSAPIHAILDQIDQVAMDFKRLLFPKKISDPAKRAENEQMLEQLDLALAFVLRRLQFTARFRARSTKSLDLLGDVMFEMINYGSEAAKLVRRHQKEFPEDIRDQNGLLEDGGYVEVFAWDVYLRVVELDRLADEFPEHVRLAARDMQGWPMLIHRHTANKKRFAELAKRFDLGANYPLDASGSARFRPNSPLVRYLEPLISKICLSWDLIYTKNEATDREQRDEVRLWWWSREGEIPSEELLDVLCAIPKLPELTKGTSREWASKALVPLILATDALDWKNCTEPALKQIAKQRGVKSRATFKSRLLPAVTATLRALARA